MRRQVLEHLRFLHEIGVDSLVVPAVETQVTAMAAPVVAPEPTAPAVVGTGGAKLLALRQTMGECTRCRLSTSRTQIVFGVGNPEAELMFIGEAPGRDEDLRGEPFVGRAGQLLDRMIASIGMQRSEVYIANVVKCRPPDNRNPETDEIEACGEFLSGQIEIIAPKIIVTLGKFAASTLFGENVAITRARGQLRGYRGVPVMPTYHPAYLLRQYTQENRRAVYDDLLQVKAILDS